MTWKELKDKISLMTEEEQQQEVAVWGEDISLRNKDCSLEKTNEALYYDPKWDYALEESELEPEDKDNPDVYKICEAGVYYISIKKIANHDNERTS